MNTFFKYSKYVKYAVPMAALAVFSGTAHAAEISVTDAIDFLNAERVTIGVVAGAVLVVPVLGLISRTISSIFHRA